jgi:hypothetical protein
MLSVALLKRQQSLAAWQQQQLLHLPVLPCSLLSLLLLHTARSGG